MINNGLKNSTNQYESIGDKYDEFVKHIVHQMLDSSFINKIGSLKNKSVLDLGCGDGHLTRFFKKMGAKKVVGVDISQKMIEIAKSRDVQNSYEIEYIKADVLELGEIGNFDIVTGAFLLHYARSKQELNSMCEVICKNLTKGGEFVGLVNNFELKPVEYNNNYKKYEGYPYLLNSKLIDGSVIRWRVDSDADVIEFDTYYYSRHTYQTTFLCNGLSTFKWYKPEVEKSIYCQRPPSFWEYLENHPFIIIIKAAA